MMLVGHEVLILQRRCVLGASLHKTTESASFEVVDATHIVFVIEPQRVAHEHQVDLLVVLHLDCVYTVDP